MFADDYGDTGGGGCEDYSADEDYDGFDFDTSVDDTDYSAPYGAEDADSTKIDIEIIDPDDPDVAGALNEKSEDDWKGAGLPEPTEPVQPVHHHDIEIRQIHISHFVDKPGEIA